MAEEEKGASVAPSDVFTTPGGDREAQAESRASEPRPVTGEPKPRRVRKSSSQEQSLPTRFRANPAQGVGSTPWMHEPSSYRQRPPPLTERSGAEGTVQPLGPLVPNALDTPPPA